MVSAVPHTSLYKLYRYTSIQYTEYKDTAYNYRIQDTVNRILGYSIHDTGYSMQDTRIQHTKYSIQYTGY